MNVIDYVREEVFRQGHDVSSLDGIERVGWMLEAWSYALCESGDGNLPNFERVVEIGKMVERNKNRLGLRKVGVRVGHHIRPNPGSVRDKLHTLFAVRDELTPIEFYKEFELIHPFADGNRRTGKVLLNWLNGTLLDPIFPPADLFGVPIQNP